MIDGADEIIVNFNDGTKLKVDKVVGNDTKTDLALLKVERRRSRCPPCRSATPTRSRVGDWVMAIGNPFGLGGTVTVGIVSARERDINAGPYDDFLQTDAAINHGNSGGPLFNMDGEVIGINTAIISPTGGSIGIGFAMPSDTATVVVDQLRRVRRDAARLARRQDPVRDRRPRREPTASQENTGALVAERHARRPCPEGRHQAEGDVILKFDGKDVTTMRGLPRLVAQTPIGKDVDVEVIRKGQKRSFRVAVGRLAEEDEPTKGASKDVPKGSKKGAPKSKEPEKQGQGGGTKPSGQALFGLGLAPLTDDLRSKYNLDPKTKGVLVTEVDPASPAAEKGIKAGDVIVEIAQEPVNRYSNIQLVSLILGKVRFFASVLRRSGLLLARLREAAGLAREQGDPDLNPDAFAGLGIKRERAAREAHAFFHAN